MSFGKMYDDEYESIFDNGDDAGFDYLDLSEDDPYEEIEEIRGTISIGDCCLCGAPNAMKYEGGVCFICSECGESVSEDLYYMYVLGIPVEDAD